MTQHIKLLLGMLVSYTGMPGSNPSTSDFDPTSCSCSVEAAGDGPRAWNPAARVGGQCGFLSFHLGLGQALVVVGV